MNSPKFIYCVFVIIIVQYISYGILCLLLFYERTKRKSTDNCVGMFATEHLSFICSGGYNGQTATENKGSNL